MLRSVESLINEVSNMMSVNSRCVIILILAIATITTTVTMQSINVYFITAFISISASLYLAEIYRFIMNKIN